MILMKMFVSKKYGFVAVVLFLSLTIQAQEFSLKDAIKIALERNYQIQISQQQQQIAQKNNTWSEAGLFPTVTLNVSSNNAIQDNRENPFTFTPVLLLQQGLTPSLNVNWNVFSGFLVKMTKTRLEHLETQSGGNAMLLIENTVFEVIKSYYSTVLQREKLALLEELLGYSRERLKLIEIKKDFGASNSLDLMQFKNQYLSDSMNVMMQQLTYENAMRNLALFLNFDLDTLLNPTDALNYNFPVLNAEAFRQDLMKNNRNIQNQYINLSLAETQTKVQQSFLYPTVNVQFGYQYAKNSLRALDVPDLSANINVPNYYANVTLRYNIYNNWKSKRAVEVAKIQEDIARLNLEDVKRSVANQGELLIRMYKVRSDLVTLSTENLIYAQKAYELALERFNFGTINSIDLMSVRNQYVQTKLTHLDNLYARVEVFFDLSRLLGLLSLEYQ